MWRNYFLIVAIEALCSLLICVKFLYVYEDPQSWAWLWSNRGMWNGVGEAQVSQNASLSHAQRYGQPPYKVLQHHDQEVSPVFSRLFPPTCCTHRRSHSHLDTSPIPNGPGEEGLVFFNLESSLPPTWDSQEMSPHGMKRIRSTAPCSLDHRELKQEWGGDTGDMQDIQSGERLLWGEDFFMPATPAK